MQWEVGGIYGSAQISITKVQAWSNVISVTRRWVGVKFAEKSVT